MKKAIYIHGLGSNSNSSTGKYLKEHLVGYEVLTPDVPFEPSKARAFVMELLNKERPELVVASSLGAFYVMIYGTNFPCTKLFTFDLNNPNEKINYMNNPNCFKLEKSDVVNLPDKIEDVINTQRQRVLDLINSEEM